MIQPVLQADALLEDIRASAVSKSDALHVWWLGQSGFLVQWRGRHLLLDPYLSDALTAKYAATDKPHVRMTARVVAPDRLDFIDVVTSSHTHTDHLDAATLLPLFEVNQGLNLVLPEVNRALAAERIGCDARALTGLTMGESRHVAGFSFTTVPAAHEEVEPAFAGFVVSAGPWTVYHSGDTLRYDGMEDVLRPHDVDLALLPINGRAPERRVAGNLDGREAAELAHAIGARMVVPCHYEMFAFNTASPELFVRTCEQLGQPYTVLRAGERLILQA